MAIPRAPLQPAQIPEQIRDLYENPNFTAGWGTLMLINAGLAQGKNRSGLNWFFISLFLGPVATFFLVAFCDKLPASE